MKKFITGFIMLAVLCGAAFIAHDLSLTSLDYCKELARILDKTELEQFKFKSIYCSDVTYYSAVIDFDVKYSTKYDRYDNLDIVDDVIKVRNIIINYLEDNKDNKLNEKKIRIYFGKEGNPEEPICSLKNYNNDNEKAISSTDLNYYYGMRVTNLSSAGKLENVKRMVIYADNIDSVGFLSGWSDIEYLRIWSRDWEENSSKKSEIKEIFDTYEIISDDDYQIEIEKTE